MKILHLCLGCFYIDNYSYQENLIPKYHKIMGNEVYIIASTISFDNNGNSSYVEATSYINENGIPVKRLPYKTNIPSKISKMLRLFDDVYESIEEVKPDIVFIHGCQFWHINQVIKYIKNNEKVKVYVDNHADFSNSARNWISKNILHKIIWKNCAHKILPYTEKFYGVLPARVDFLKNIYKIPNNKVQLLVMGADDELVKLSKNKDVQVSIREKYKIKKTDFLVITGGKIDKEKYQVLNLIKTVNKLESNVKLIIFGSIVPELKERVLSLCDNKKTIYVGWLNNEETYKYLASADLAVYPGRHSVLWEQTVGLGIPMIVKYWEGTNHIDLDGNVKFLYTEKEEEIYTIIRNLIDKKDEYLSMKIEAEKKGIKYFSYKNIAIKSIEAREEI